MIRESVTAPEDSDGTAAYATPLWLYAVASAGAEIPPEIHGVAEAPVHTVEHAGLAAIVSPVNPEQPAAGRRDLLAHSAVVDQVRRRCTLLPVQFGSVLEDAETLQLGLLEARREELHELLADVEGRSQFNVRARYIEDQVLGEIVRESPQIAELRRRTRDAPEELVYGDKVRLGELVAARMDEKRANDAQVLLDVVVPQSVAHVIRDVGAAEVLNVAILVEDASEKELTDVLEGLAEAVHERIRLELVGPMAPFDFAGGL